MTAQAGGSEGSEREGEEERRGLARGVAEFVSDYQRARIFHTAAVAFVLSSKSKFGIVMVNKEDMDTVLSSVLSDSRLIELIKRRVISQMKDPAHSVDTDYNVLIASTINRTFQELGIGEMVTEFLCGRKKGERMFQRGRDISMPSYSHTEPGQVHRQRGKRRARTKSDGSGDMKLVSSTGDCYDLSRTQVLGRSGPECPVEANTSPTAHIYLPAGRKIIPADESCHSSLGAEDAAAAHLEGHVLDEVGDDLDSVVSVLGDDVGLDAGVAVYESMSEDEVKQATAANWEEGLQGDNEVMTGEGGRQSAATSVDSPVGEPSGRDGVADICLPLVSDLLNSCDGFLFADPVDFTGLGIPDYPLIVHKPMDLGTVRSRLSKDIYCDVNECFADVRLCFDNAMLYCLPDSSIYVAAKRLRYEFDSKVRELHLVEREAVEEEGILDANSGLSEYEFDPEGGGPERDIENAEDTGSVAVTHVPAEGGEIRSSAAAEDGMVDDDGECGSADGMSGADYSLNDFDQPSASTTSPTPSPSRTGGDFTGRPLVMEVGPDGKLGDHSDDNDEYGQEEGDRRVQFPQDVVSDTFYHRLKYAPDEVADLFYTHEEAMQFQYDYDREATKAEAEGREWTEWIMERTEEELAADELEYAAVQDDFRNYWDGDEYEGGSHEDSTDNMWEF